MGKINNKQIKKSIKHSPIFFILMSIVIIFIGIFIMSKKEGMDFDEIGTFGLANNTFQLDIEDFKEYNGHDLLLKYAAVKDGEEFNVANVFFNQKMDTHPPLYYLLINFVCSLRKGTFSMWCGLIINLIFMVVLFWEMRYLFNVVIDDDLMSTIFSALSFFAYGFVNEIVFIRMYVMLSAISMAFVILIIKIIKIFSAKTKNMNTVVANANNVGANVGNVGAKHREPAILLTFFSICLLGILTQYHFMILAFYFSLILGIYLIYKKEFKMLLAFIFAGVLSIATSLLIFPGILNHIFGDSSLHALNGNQLNSLGRIFFEITMSIYKSFFGAGIWVYLAVLILGIILASKNLKKNNQNLKKIIVNNIWLLLFVLCCIFYYLVVCFTTKYSFARYLYNIYPLILICTIAPIYLLFKEVSKKVHFKYISLLVLIILILTSRINENPFSLNINNKEFYEFLNANRDIKVLGLYRSIDKNNRNNTQNTSLWKLPRPLYVFRDMKSISFADLSTNENILYFNDDRISKNDTLFVVIYTEEDDNEILGGLMGSQGFANVDRVYFNTYYHMYKISK